MTARSLANSLVSSFAGTLSSSASAGAIKNGLLEWWSLNEVSGNRTGSHANLLLTDNNGVTSGTGKVGNAASFTGTSSQSLSINNVSIAGALNSSYSVACWFNPGAALTSPEPIWGGSPAGPQIQTFRVDAGNWNFSSTNPTETQSLGGASNTPTITTDTWFHTVVVKPDVTTLRVYINGTLVINVTNSNMTMGGITTLTLAEFAGNFSTCLIDELAVWNRALTEPEILTLYNGGNGVSYAQL